MLDELVRLQPGICNYRDPFFISAMNGDQGVRIRPALVYGGDPAIACKSIQNGFQKS